MNKIQIDQKIIGLKRGLKKIGSTLIEASDKFGLEKETREILKGQIAALQDNFLFVIVGEVNAGKSSFVNALLGAPICATSFDICTSEVQKIVYGDAEKTTMDSSKRISRRAYPAEILKDITIVDTPGTNSKVIDHQIITERFIPHSNLVVFVFMTENIHVETAWDLFRKIKDKWGKKVIFVLTKTDKYDKTEIENYSKTLSRYAYNEGINEPIIFETSAKLEDEGKTEDSGFSPLRHFINTKVLGNAAEEKIKDDLKTLKTIFKQISDEFELRKIKHQNDTSTREAISMIIQQQEDNAKDSISNLTSSCLRVFDQNTGRATTEIEKGIGFLNITWKSVRSIFGGETTETWLEGLNKELTENLNKDINLVLAGGTDSIKNDIQYMLTHVKNELDKLKEIEVQPTQMFAHLDERRNEIVHNLKHNLTNFIDKSPLFRDDEGLKGVIDYSGVNVAGGIAAIGAVIAAIAQGSVIDITGGIATALGLLIAGGIAFNKKGKYLREVRNTLDLNRDNLEVALEGRLLGYFTKIKDSIAQQFEDFDQRLKTEENQILSFDSIADAVKHDINIVEKNI